VLSPSCRRELAIVATVVQPSLRWRGWPFSCWPDARAGFKPQPGPGAEPPAGYVTLTRPITALGDTQEHESTGFPLHDNDSAIDA